MPEPIWSQTLGPLRVELHPDPDAESPREWSCFGHMACWHRRYTLGDEQPRLSPSDWLRTLPEKSLTLPLYLYDHSGITMNTTGFSCPWDSGQVGFITVSHADILKEYSRKRLSKKLLAQAREVLIAEVSSYDLFLRGEVYSYSILDESDDVIDSCAGLFGYTYAIEEATRALKSATLQEAP